MAAKKSKLTPEEEAAQQAAAAAKAAAQADKAAGGTKARDRRSSARHAGVDGIEALAKRRGLAVVFLVRSMGGTVGTQDALSAGPDLTCPDDGRNSVIDEETGEVLELGEDIEIAGRNWTPVILNGQTRSFLERCLASDFIDVAVPGSRKPWPGSASDRSSTYPEKKFKRLPGDDRPHPGPEYMRRLEAQGGWPKDEDLGWMQYHAERILDDEGAIRALLSDQGLSGAKLESAVRRAKRRKLSSGGAPDIQELKSLHDAREAQARSQAGLRE